MREFRDMSSEEAFCRVHSLLSASMLLSVEDDDVTRSLGGLLRAINEGDILLCSRRYHELTRALTLCPARRVSGELWQDYLLHRLIAAPHAFSEMAAMGDVIEPVYAAMRSELTTLGALSALDSTVIKRLIRERQRELRLKPGRSGARDEISMLSTAAWSGAQTKPQAVDANPQSASRPMLQPQTPLEIDFISWRYGEVGLREHWTADASLEAIYYRFIETREWREEIDDLWNAFNSCGTGEFMRSRAFRLSGEKLSPLPESALELSPHISLTAEVREAALDNTISFMRGEPAEHLLLFGAPGMGKTHIILSMAAELPEVRLILVSDVADAPRAFELASKQPLRFIIAIDGVDVSSRAFRENVSSRVATCEVPKNVLLYISARGDAPASSAPFARVLRLPTMGLKEFSDAVKELLEYENKPFDHSELKNACIDHQVDARDSLSVGAAVRLANRF